MSRGPSIRPERPEDRAAIHTVVTAAFGRPVEADLVDRLRAAGALTISLVALVDGAIVGHIAFSPVTIDGGGHALGLAPLAVQPARQRQGIGSALVQAGLAACRAQGASSAFVLGDPAYYPRFGFERADAFGLRWEGGFPDAFMIMRLDDLAPMPSPGLVHFRPEFAGV